MTVITVFFIHCQDDSSFYYMLIVYHDEFVRDIILIHRTIFQMWDCPETTFLNLLMLKTPKYDTTVRDSSKLYSTTVSVSWAANQYIRMISEGSCDTIIIIIIIKLRWALFVTYTIIQSIMRSEMCSLNLTHPSVHTPGAVGSRHSGSRGAVGGSVPCSRVSPQSWTIPARAEIRTHNLGLQIQRSIH